MKKPLLTLVAVLGMVLSMNAQVTDVDGNVYSTVTIGSQTWMAENLRTTRYSDGTAIPYVNSDAGWDALTVSSSAYCWYNDDISNRDVHGVLYSWAAAMNGGAGSETNPSEAQGVCPTGWHLPSWAEWGDLIHFLDPAVFPPYYSGGGIVGGKMKETGTSHWEEPNTGATNESGFTALPSGGRGESGNSIFIDTLGIWWSTTKWGDDRVRTFSVRYNTVGYSMNSTPLPSGLSVRCLQDSELTDEFSISVQDLIVDEGQPLEVPISVSELTVADNIISYQFDIDFDNSVLEYTGNDITGTLAEGGTVFVNTDITGRLSISYMNSTAMVGTGNILRLQFNSLATDTSELSLSNAYLNSTVVDNLTNGTVIVRDITPPTAAITYNDTDIRVGDMLIITASFSEPILASNAVNINLSGAAVLSDAGMTRQSETVYTYSYSVPTTNGDVTLSLSNGTDYWNNEVVPVPSSGESFTIVGLTLGDVDDDGIILAYDAALTLQYSVGLEPLPTMDPLPWENWRVSTANVDGTAGITANDAGMILQYSAGIISDFSGGSKKSAPQAFISMEFRDKEIIFYSHGELLGLNVSVDNDFNILGEPIILAEGFMSAFNIGESIYRFGICTSNPPADGEAILKIPYTKSGSVSINMIVNDVAKTLPLNLTTGISDFAVKEVSIYPNPVRDNLNVSGIRGETTARIYNINGQLMFTSILNNPESKINLSELPVGLYIMKLETDMETTVKRFIKR